MHWLYYINLDNWTWTFNLIIQNIFDASQIIGGKKVIFYLVELLYTINEVKREFRVMYMSTGTFPGFLYGKSDLCRIKSQVTRVKYQLSVNLCILLAYLYWPGLQINWIQITKFSFDIGSSGHTFNSNKLKNSKW